LSLALHLLLIYLLTADFSSHEAMIIERAQGAGGLGPAGGGGGGHRGTGGIQEHVQYVAVAPAPAPKPARVATQPAIVPPPVVVPPKPKPVVPPPVLPKPVEPQLIEVKAEPKIEAPKVEAPKAEAPKSDATAPVAGTGGGTGRDGSAGNGPGSGGGVGSGVGTGRGSGVGPGTGGGVQANYPPTPTELFIPPLPMPEKVRGFHLIAEYDIDETGKVVDFNFTPTRDGGYNKRLKEVLGSFKFRPGTSPDGTPMRMKAQIVYDF